MLWKYFYEDDIKPEIVKVKIVLDANLESAAVERFEIWVKIS